MPDNIINFKRAKKKAGYAAKEAQSANNRVKFGRTKAENLTNELQATKSKSHIDGHKIEPK